MTCASLQAVVGLREELQSSEEALQEAKAQSEALASVQLEAERLEELATERQAERQAGCGRRKRKRSKEWTCRCLARC